MRSLESRPITYLTTAGPSLKLAHRWDVAGHTTGGRRPAAYSSRTPDKLEGQNEYNTLQALVEDAASCSTVYYWPKENRPAHETKTGTLHVKCTVADGRWLLLSSANLTEHAFTINMELGVLITGGNLPAQAEAHFDRLISTSVLEKE